MGDHIFFKVMPKRGMVRFSKRGKLLSRYFRPFKVLEMVGTIAYRLALPPSLSGVMWYSMSQCARSTLHI